MKLLRYKITVKQEQFQTDISHTRERKKQIVGNIKFFLPFFVKRLTTIRKFV